jgi:hypothetical protein
MKMGRKALYYLLVIAITIGSTNIMLNMRKTNKGINPSEIDYESWMEDTQYEGYIFDDYNKKVSIDYIDNVYKKPDAKQNNAIDESAFKNFEKDDKGLDFRMLKNEMEIEQRSISDSMVKNESNDAMGAVGIDTDLEMEDRDNMVILVRSLYQNEIPKFKKLFDAGISKNEVDSIMDELSGRLSQSDKDWLLKVIENNRVK